MYLSRLTSAPILQTKIVQISLSRYTLTLLKPGLLQEQKRLLWGWTKAVPRIDGTIDPAIVRFLEAGKIALQQGIAQAVVGNHVGHISQRIQQVIESQGYSLVPTLVGHGIGVGLHEQPYIPNVLQKSIDKTPVLQEGLVVAIEPIYAQKSPKTVRARDGWTIKTVDKSLAAQFEHTIAITSKGPIVLT